MSLGHSRQVPRPAINIHSSRSLYLLPGMGKNVFIHPFVPTFSHTKEICLRKAGQGTYPFVPWEGNEL
jgi:hypothetical protein